MGGPEYARKVGIKALEPLGLYLPVRIKSLNIFCISHAGMPASSYVALRRGPLPAGARQTHQFFEHGARIYGDRYLSIVGRPIYGDRYIDIYDRYTIEPRTIDLDRISTIDIRWLSTIDIYLS